MLNIHKIKRFLFTPHLDSKDVADGFVQNDMLVDAMFTNSGVDDSNAESLVGKNRQRVKNAWLDDEADEDDDDDDYKGICGQFTCACTGIQNDILWLGLTNRQCCNWSQLGNL